MSSFSVIPVFSAHGLKALGSSPSPLRSAPPDRVWGLGFRDNARPLHIGILGNLGLCVDGFWLIFVGDMGLGFRGFCQQEYTRLRQVQAFSLQSQSCKLYLKLPKPPLFFVGSY